MSVLAPVIAGGCVFMAGLAVLIWMNLSQPTLEKSPAKEPEPEREFEPLHEDVWHGRVELGAMQAYTDINVHPK